MPLRIDQFRIDRHERVGERLRVDGHLSRTGVQIYDQGDGTVRREQRDASEVFAPSALASMRGMPVTIGHPSLQMVDARNWRTLAVGHTGDDVRPAEDGVHTAASIWLMDADAQARVERQDLTELSVGYYAELDETPGVNDAGERYDARQIGIRGNHLALLESGQARGGPGCRLRLDSAGNACATGPASRPEERKMKIKIKADGYDHEVEADSDALAVALDRERTEMKRGLDALQAKFDETTARLDAETAKSTDLAAKLADATDPAKVAARVDEISKLRADAKSVAGVDVTGTTPEEIRRAALEARKIDLADKSDSYVEARFDAELDRARTDQIGRARLAPATQVPAVDQLDLAAVISNALARKAGE